MRKFALMALLLPSVANAGAFLRTQLPATNTFEFNWTSAGVLGSTTFTFDDGVRDTTGVVCGTLDACMDGTFTTGNSGEGVFATDVRVDSCTLVGSPSAFAGIFTRQRLRCDVHQMVELVYDSTGATYSGEAAGGTVTWWAVFSPSGLFLGVQNTTQSTNLTAGSFSGTLSGPGTGTFTEI